MEAEEKIVPIELHSRQKIYTRNCRVNSVVLALKQAARGQRRM